MIEKTKQLAELAGKVTELHLHHGSTFIDIKSNNSNATFDVVINGSNLAIEQLEDFIKNPTQYILSLAEKEEEEDGLYQ